MGPAVLYYPEEMLLQFANQPANQKVRKQFEDQMGNHPCLSMPMGCKNGDRCVLKELPRVWCAHCLTGEPHAQCMGIKPPTHPCIRVWNSCKFGDSCAFKKYPMIWCMFCLRGQEHKKCSGIRPKIMPNIGGELVAACKEHQQKVAARTMQQLPAGQQKVQTTNSMLQQAGVTFAHSSLPSILLAPQTANVEPQQSGFEVLRTTVAPTSPAPMLPTEPVDVELPHRCAVPFGRAKKEKSYDVKINSTMNKICPEKFDSLKDTLVKDICEAMVEADSDETKVKHIADVLAKAIFNRAVEVDQLRSEMYSRLTAEVGTRLREVAPDSKMNTLFRRCLLTLLQEVFYKIPEFPSVHEDGTPVSAEERETLVSVYRDKARSNTRFIGELYVHNQVTDNIINEVGKQLLHQGAKLPLEYRIDMLESLLQAAGGEIQRRAAKNPQLIVLLDGWFQRMNEIRKSCATRTTHQLDSLVELRQNNWVARMQHEKPATMAECNEQFTKQQDERRSKTTVMWESARSVAAA